MMGAVSHFLALTTIVTVAYQFFLFIITAILKFDKLTDFAGTTNFIVLSILTLVLKGSWHFRQTIRAWTVSLPVTAINVSDNQPSLRARDIIGWIMWSLGILVEITADQQKLKFKSSQENKRKWCNVGLWKYSCHPNYFGEIFLWWGIFVASTLVLEGAEWLVVFGSVFLTLLLFFVSSLPLLEVPVHNYWFFFLFFKRHISQSRS